LPCRAMRRFAFATLRYATPLLCQALLIITDPRPSASHNCRPCHSKYHPHRNHYSVKILKTNLP
jgi:hypothetical protein